MSTKVLPNRKKGGKRERERGVGRVVGLETLSHGESYLLRSMPRAVLDYRKQELLYRREHGAPKTTGLFASGIIRNHKVFFFCFLWGILFFSFLDCFLLDDGPADRPRERVPQQFGANWKRPKEKERKRPQKKSRGDRDS